VAVVLELAVPELEAPEVMAIQWTAIELVRLEQVVYHPLVLQATENYKVIGKRRFSTNSVFLS
jgi:hypothetical protein